MRFEKTVGKFHMEWSDEASPIWVTITFGHKSFSLMQLDDLKDLKYLIDRSIEEMQQA